MKYTIVGDVTLTPSCSASNTPHCSFVAILFFCRFGGLLFQFEPVVGMSSLLEFLRFLYTGRTGAMEPLTALDLLFLTKGDEGSGGTSTPRVVLKHPCLCLPTLQIRPTDVLCTQRHQSSAQAHMRISAGLPQNGTVQQYERCPTLCCIYRARLGSTRLKKQCPCI